MSCMWQVAQRIRSPLYHHSAHAQPISNCLPSSVLSWSGNLLRPSKEGNRSLVSEWSHNKCPRRQAALMRTRKKAGSFAPPKLNHMCGLDVVRIHHHTSHSTNGDRATVVTFIHESGCYLTERLFTYLLTVALWSVGDAVIRVWAIS